MHNYFSENMFGIWKIEVPGFVYNDQSKEKFGTKKIVWFGGGGFQFRGVPV